MSENENSLRGRSGSQQINTKEVSKAVTNLSALTYLADPHSDEVIMLLPDGRDAKDIVINSLITIGVFRKRIPPALREEFMHYDSLPLAHEVVDTLLKAGVKSAVLESCAHDLSLEEKMLRKLNEQPLGFDSERWKKGKKVKLEKSTASFQQEIKDSRSRPAASYQEEVKDKRNPIGFDGRWSKG